MRYAVLGLIVAIGVSRPASAQQRRQCHMERFSSPTPEQSSEYTWLLGRRGRVRGYTEHNRSIQRAFRWSASELVRIEEHPFDGDTEHVGRWAQRGSAVIPVGVTRPREDVVMITESPPANVPHTTEIHFDARGLPVLIVDDSHLGTFRRHHCAYDVDGRPVHRTTEYWMEGEGHDPAHLERQATRQWRWFDGRVVQVSTEIYGESEYAVHHRPGYVQLSSERGSGETWTGQCNAVFFDVCAPELYPAPSRQLRTGRGPARSPALLGPRPRRGLEMRQPQSWPSELTHDPLTLRRIRRAFRGYDVWTEVRFGESSPDTALPMVCIGQRGGPCLTEVWYEEETHLLARIVTRDTSMGAGQRVQVGQPMHQAAGGLGLCELDGFEPSIRCQIQDGGMAVFAADDSVVARSPAQPVPSAEQLVLRIEHSRDSR